MCHIITRPHKNVILNYNYDINYLLFLKYKIMLSIYLFLIIKCSHIHAYAFIGYEIGIRHNLFNE